MILLINLLSSKQMQVSVVLRSVEKQQHPLTLCTPSDISSDKQILFVVTFARRRKLDVEHNKTTALNMQICHCGNKWGRLTSGLRLHEVYELIRDQNNLKQS
jgi:hypothetical protein